MIYCIWYPSGGFGHYISAVLSLHGKNFKRHNELLRLNFDKEGRSHHYMPVVPKYMWSQEHYHYDFDTNINYGVLVDNGINNPDVAWKKFFPDAKIIKICYNDDSWPLILQTYAVKALRTSMVETYQLPDSTTKSYLGVLLNNKLRTCYKPDPDCLTLEISDLFEYNKLKTKLESFGIVLSEFADLWKQWRAANATYIDPLDIAKQVVSDVKHCNLKDLSIADTLTQAITLFYLSIEYPNCTLPTDEFFSSIQEIIDWTKT